MAPSSDKDASGASKTTSTWRKTPAAEGIDGRTATGEVLSPQSLAALTENESARDFVRKARESMGFLSRFKFDNQTQGEVRRIAGEIAVNIFNAQKVVMLQKIAAGVALEQRNTLTEFLNEVILNDEAVRSLVGRAETGLRYALEEEALAILQEKKRKIDEADVLTKNGKLTPEDSQAMKDFYASNAEKLIEDKSMRVSTITQSYIDQFEDALKKYRERHIREQTLI